MTQQIAVLACNTEQCQKWAQARGAISVINRRGAEGNDWRATFFLPELRAGETPRYNARSAFITSCTFDELVLLSNTHIVAGANEMVYEIMQVMPGARVGVYATEAMPERVKP